MFDWPQVVLVLGVLAVATVVHRDWRISRSRVVEAELATLKTAAELGARHGETLAARVAKVEHALRIDAPMKPTLPAMMR